MNELMMAFGFFVGGVCLGWVIGTCNGIDRERRRRR